jgi:hypothetical protein
VPKSENAEGEYRAPPPPEDEGVTIEPIRKYPTFPKKSALLVVAIGVIAPPANVGSM